MSRFASWEGEIPRGRGTICGVNDDVQPALSLPCCLVFPLTVYRHRKRVESFPDKDGDVSLRVVDVGVVRGTVSLRQVQFGGGGGRLRQEEERFPSDNGIRV